MIKKYGLIFDLDGVVNVGTFDLMQAMIELARVLGLPLPTLAMLQRLWGNGWHELQDELAQTLSWAPTQLDEFKTELAKKDSHNYNYKAPGWDDFIEPKREHGLAILTNRTRPEFEYALDLIDLDLSPFNIVQTRTDFIFPKPDPRAFIPILKVFAELDIERQNVIYFGDTVSHDYWMARNAVPSIPFRAIISGANPKEWFLEIGLEEKFILNAVTEFDEI